MTMLWVSVAAVRALAVLVVQAAGEPPNLFFSHEVCHGRGDHFWLQDQHTETLTGSDVQCLWCNQHQRLEHRHLQGDSSPGIQGAC